MMTPQPMPGHADVWVVEDNALFRETLAGLLNDSERLQCSMAFGACEPCLDALAADLLPDLLLMDIGLPGMDGIAGVEAVQRLAPSLPVVMLTVHEDNDLIFRALCAGAAGYLLKSAPRAEIRRAVEGVLGGGAAMHPQIARRVLDMFARLALPRADYGLSEREQEILTHLVGGRTKREIAERLFLSPHTVDNHIRNVYAKLHVHNRSGAVAKALAENLVRTRRP